MVCSVSAMRLAIPAVEPWPLAYATSTVTAGSRGRLVRRAHRGASIAHPVGRSVLAAPTVRYRFLSPTLGFLAGWTFLLAKSASAATAALGFSGYTLDLFDQDGDWLVSVAVVAVVGVVLVVLAGISRSSQVNTVVVTITRRHAGGDRHARRLGGAPLWVR